MNQIQACSRCGAPLSFDVAGGVCARCSSAASTIATTTSSFKPAVDPAKPISSPSSFWEDVRRTIGDTFQLVNQRPYILLAFGYGFYRKLKGDPNYTWGLFVGTAVAVVGAVALYAIVRAAIPRIVALLNATPASPPPIPSLHQPTPPANGQGWWLMHGGRPTGPHPLSHLLDAAERGDFAIDVLVCPVGSQQWIALRTVLPPPQALSAPTFDPPSS